jgi:hypothetical protein
MKISRIIYILDIATIFQFSTLLDPYLAKRLDARRKGQSHNESAMLTCSLPIFL